MMIYTLSQKQRTFFLDFIPSDILLQVGVAGYYSIGVFDETADRDPIGFVQFYFGYKDYDENEPYMRLTWLYVREDHRYNGAGEKLLDTVINAANSSKVKYIEACIPFEADISDRINTDPGDEKEQRAVLSDTGELKRCLEKAGFTFAEGRRFAMEKTIEQCAKVRFPDWNMPSETKPLSSLNKIEWNEVLKDAPGEVAAALRQALSDAGPNIYDFNVSCVYINEDQLRGLILVRKLMSGGVTISALREIRGNDPRVVLHLLKSSLNYAREVYDPDQSILIENHSESGEKLIQKIFGDDEPAKIFVGHFGL